MSKLLIVCFIFLSYQANSQFVNIPDSNFRNFLVAKYPTCFNAFKQMDTTCQAINLETSLVCNSRNIGSLEGLQYFKKLNSFACNNNAISYFPKLPNSIIYF